MRESLAPLRAEALALAAAGPAMSIRSGAASAAHPGTAGRRRSGPGENFWQYRRYIREDGADRIDWRRSARGERLYVRETELETARTYLFWVDPAAGFHWRSDPALPNKASRAAVLVMALAAIVAGQGERCGALGGPRSPSSGARAPERVGEDLWTTPADAPFPPVNAAPASLVVASDFYGAMDNWTARISALGARNRSGALLAVRDPAERSFPFDGRTRFSRPGDRRDRLIGRAETIRDAYLERFAEREADIVRLAESIGWNCVFHSTDEPPGEALAALMSGFALSARSGA